MLITRETDYAMRAVLYLARTGINSASVGEIARAMHIPKSYLAKLLQRLVRHHVLASSRGMNGGFRLARSASRISLLDIVEAMQGPTAINLCAVDAKRCRFSATCAVHPVWVEIRQQMEGRLRRETIKRLAARSTA